MRCAACGAWTAANPQTFVYTTWYTQQCSRAVLTPYYHGFDVETAGLYVNYDFWFYLTTNVRPVGIFATAGVGFTNSTPYWSGDYYEIGLDDISGVVQKFLLSEQRSGFAYETDCHTICDPSDQVVFDCEHQQDSFYWDYQLCQCVGGASPVLVDVDNDGLALTDSGHGVVFDVLASGRPVRVAWTAQGANDGFLTLDRNSNGIVDDGSELFGNYTQQPRPTKSKERPNGFSALSVFDALSAGGNDDGQITEEDAIYSRLKLWFDSNHDGVSQPAELKTLDAIGLRALSLHYIAGKRVDEFGNVLGFRSHVTFDKDAFDGGPFKRQAIDVFLSYVAAP